MTISERQKRILKVLQEERQATVADLANRFQVTEASIRLDLNHLETMDYVKRFRGGARPVRTSAYEQRMKDNLRLKRRIAQRALEYIATEDTLFLDSGTTLLLLSKLLVRFDRLTIVTNSLPIANLIGREQSNSVILAGGIFNYSEQCCEGAMIETFLDNFHASRAFIGADSVDVDKGLYSNGVSVVGYVNKIIDNSKSTILLADSSKFDKVGTIKICGLKRIDTIITDKNVPESTVGRLADLGVKVDIA
jgi:DeoR/GlpR family transcriptional regulator of sugar metabolism